MTPDSRVIKLPSRSTYRVKAETQPMMDMFGELADMTAKFDLELAEIVRAWPNLSQDLKNTLLSLAAVGK